MALEFYAICKICLFDAAYLGYALLVFGVGVAASRRAIAVTVPSGAPTNLPPIPSGELPFRNPPKVSIASDFFSFALDLASFAFFRRIMRWAAGVIRTIFLMRDDPSVLRSFWRYFNVYYLVIVLPAAFMPPVLHPQRPPDFHLLAAVVLLICTNAFGDIVSVRVVLNILKEAERVTGETATNAARWKDELIYYLAVAGGGICSLVVLVVVLVCSSVLYGVQVGQLDFDISVEFVRGAWQRATRFHELAWMPYWFRGQPGPFGSLGIPGLFIYGLSTFIPIILLTLGSLFWVLLLPFRLAVNLPPTTPAVLRVISAEVAVFVMCLIITSLLGRFVFS